MKIKKTLFIVVVVFSILGFNNMLRDSESRVSIAEYATNNTENILTPAAYRRPLDQTILSYPEWFLVFSSNEYAKFLAHDMPNNFNFFGHILQFWSSYYNTTKFSSQLETSNIQYHIMLVVIGISTSIEYAIRGLYNQTIGMLTAKISGRSKEDDFDAEYSKEYVDLIRHEPWYKFDFRSKLVKLWHIPVDTSHIIRSIERKFSLTMELSFKWLYAKIIGFGSESTYGVEDINTYIIVKGDVNKLPPNFDSIQKIKNNTYLIKAQRLQPFTVEIIDIINTKEVFIKEISGNDTVILVSALGKDNINLLCADCIYLFEQNILTTTHGVRKIFLAPINKLNSIFMDIDNSGYKIEHVFDY